MAETPGLPRGQHQQRRTPYQYTVISPDNHPFTVAYAPYSPLPERPPPDVDDPVVSRYNLRSQHRTPMSACNATTKARYSDATAYHILQRALNITGTPDEAHSVLNAATGDVLEYRRLC